MLGITKKTLAFLSALTPMLFFGGATGATAASTGAASSGAEVATYSECYPSGSGSFCWEEVWFENSALTPTGGVAVTWSITTNSTTYDASGAVIDDRSTMDRYVAVIQQGHRTDKLRETRTITDATGMTCTYSYDWLVTNYEVRVDNIVSHCTR